MRRILTDSTAQRIIDFVSQLYGDSYVGLWLFQVIGCVLSPVSAVAEQLKQETSVFTASLLIAEYENEYGITPDPTMTIEQRRNRVIAAMRVKGAITPVRLADAVSASLGGARVEVIEYDANAADAHDIDQIVKYGQRSGISPDAETAISDAEINGIVVLGERTSGTPDPTTSLTYNDIDGVVLLGKRQNPEDWLNKNHFIVSVKDSVNSLAPAQAVIERLKPAHLYYTLRGTTVTAGYADIKIAVATTQAILYKVEVRI